MKSILSSYISWTKIDQDTEKLVKRCALAAKSPSIKLQLWSKADIPCSRLHIHFVYSMDGPHYLVVVDSFTKSLKFVSAKRSVSTVPVKFYTNFSRYGIPDAIVPDNGEQTNLKNFVNSSRSNILLTSGITEVKRTS